MKQNLRKQAIEVRKKLNLNEISNLIYKQIFAMSEFKKAKNIGIFAPKEIEINVMPLVEDSEKSFFLPIVNGNKMDFYLYEGVDNLKVGKFGILEPVSKTMNNECDILIVPALMADLKGFRLGWGGGFYDRFLKNFSGITICPVPNCQIVDELPTNTYDKRCDFVVSETKIIKIVD